MDYFCTGGYLKESALEEAESLLELFLVDNTQLQHIWILADMKHERMAGMKIGIRFWQ